MNYNLPAIYIVSVLATIMANLASSSSCAASDIAFMLGQLTDEEIEIAACTNYEYATSPEQEIRHRCARNMAERYLNSKSDREKALSNMKATIQFRKTMGVDELRKAVSDQTANDHLPLTKFLSKRNLYVSGYDYEGRSTYVFIPRLCDDHESELKAHVWTMEKAIACSKAKDRTVNAVVDFAGFSAWNAPPLSLGQEVMTTLRQHYVGHINRIFIVNAPSCFTYLWSILKPFAGTATRDKIHFVNSKQQQKEVIGEWYSKEQAAPWMLPDGEKNRLMDPDEYLYRIPFQESFDA